MDEFYRKNADLYESLVAKFEPPPVVRGRASDSGGSIPDMLVAARVRPLLDEDIAAGFPTAVFSRPTPPGVIDVHDLYNHPRGRPILKSFTHQVDKLFDAQATTEEMYQGSLLHLVPFAWNGGIATLFAYGQTGSGKTFTISRLEELVVKSLMEGDHLNDEREIYLTIIELAGNSAFDLLNSRAPIPIREDVSGVTQLVGATEYRVQGEEDALSKIKEASAFRKTASTLKNDASSRSHAICRIRIKDPSTEADDGLLYLIDLAGSEFARDVAVHGADRMRETKEINLSLSVLKDCIRGMAEADALTRLPGPKSKKAVRIPFRGSALTKVLKHAFDPSSSRPRKMVVVACANPSLADVGATKNTLRYAEMLRVTGQQMGEVEYDPGSPGTWDNAQLREWIVQNSGSPPISPDILAPTESGAQLLQLTAMEFEYRCTKSRGVLSKQAKSFRAKFWELHAQSQAVQGTYDT
ncbi:hypothetical protein OQA88_7147 [Cercophora sp. LCS_1]